MREFGIFYQIGNGFIHCFWHKGNKKYGSEDSTRDTVILANFLSTNIAMWLYGVV